MYENLIYSTQTQVIKGGVLIEVGPLGQEAGCRVSVALTEELWGMLNAIPEDNIDSLQGMLGGLLLMGILSMEKEQSSEKEHSFKSLLQPSKLIAQPLLVKVRVAAGPIESKEMVITIMLPHED